MRFSVETISDVAKMVLGQVQLRPDGRGAALVTLSGELGAGKTTLVKAIAKELGISQTVQSPTFVLMRSYDIASEFFPWRKLIHIDAYRLSGGQDLETLGMQSLLADPHNLILIEWPERVPEIAQYPHVACNMNHVSETERSIEIKNSSQ